MNQCRPSLSLVSPPCTPGDVHAEPTRGEVIRTAFFHLPSMTIVSFQAALAARELECSDGHVTKLSTGEREPTVDEWETFQDFVSVPELVTVCGIIDARLRAGRGECLLTETGDVLPAVSKMQTLVLRALADGTVTRSEARRIAAACHTVIDEVKDVVSAAGVGA